MNSIAIEKIIITLHMFVLSMCSTLSPLDSNLYLRNNKTLRINYGFPAKLGDFPYQVSFKQGGPIYSNFCGGSIIKPKIVLSAAHCFTKESRGFCASIWRGKVVLQRFTDTHVVAANLENRARKSRKASAGQWRKIRAVKFPNGYKFPEKDIAIVVINKPWKFNAHVGIINTALRRMDYAGMECVASGYGRTETGKPAAVLMYAYLTTISINRCNRILHSNTHRFVCTGNQYNAVNKGDSGGPLVCKRTRDPNEKSNGVLVGITCAGTSNVDMFTRVTTYRNYIYKGHSNIINPSITMLLIALLFLLFSHYFFIVKNVCLCDN